MTNPHPDNFFLGGSILTELLPLQNEINWWRNGPTNPTFTRERIAYLLAVAPAPAVAVKPPLPPKRTSVGGEKHR